MSREAAVPQGQHSGRFGSNRCKKWMTTETMGNNCPLALFTEVLATFKQLSTEKYSLGQVMKSPNLT